jgi:hypothetical protein
VVVGKRDVLEPDRDARRQADTTGLVRR